MSTFSTTVTQAQRDAIDHNTRGRAISTCSRQNTKRPGYNPSPFEPKSKPSTYQSRPASTITGQLTAAELKTASPKKPAAVQVRPNTKRGQQRPAPAAQKIVLPPIPIAEFLETTCELAKPFNIFAAVYGLSHGQPCIGCAYDEQSKTGCPAKRTLLIKKGVIK